MSWPEELDTIHTGGFPRELLPLIMNAIDNDNVGWINGESSLVGGSGSGVFAWAGATFILYESYEKVTGIYLKSGELDLPAITMALLRHENRV